MRKLVGRAAKVKQYKNTGMSLQKAKVLPYYYSETGRGERRREIGEDALPARFSNGLLGEV